MADLTYAQLKGLWLSAAKGTRYDTNNWATLMAAIAEAESGGNPSALNPTDNNGTQSSFGLWQISNGTHTPPASNWADPAENAKLALGKLQGQGLTAWGTYDSGAYKAYMNGGTTPDTNIPGNSDALTAQQAAGMSADCAVNLPSYHVGVFFGHGPSVGGACLLSKSEARALLAVANLTAGAVILAVGLGMMFVLAGPLGRAVTAVTRVARTAGRVAA